MAAPIHTLLLATDFSPWARQAEEWALSLAAWWKGQLILVTVLEFPPGLNPDSPVNQRYLMDRMREATEQLTELKQQMRLRGVEISTRIETGMPSEHVVAAAQAEHADLIVLGTRGKTGLAHVLLGSTAERVIRTAPCPVLAVRDTTGTQSNRQGILLQRILVPIDLSDCSLDALEYAVLVAQQSQASLELLHVLEPVSYGLDFTLSHAAERDRTREWLAKRLDDLRGAISAAGITCASTLRGGVPAEAILEEAQARSSDLIVMGTHGRRGLSHLVSGSVAETALRRGTCPVLTVRSPKFSSRHRRVAPHTTEQNLNLSRRS